MQICNRWNLITRYVIKLIRREAGNSLHWRVSECRIGTLFRAGITTCEWKWNFKPRRHEHQSSLLDVVIYMWYAAIVLHGLNEAGNITEDNNLSWLGIERKMYSCSSALDEARNSRVKSLLVLQGWIPDTDLYIGTYISLGLIDRNLLISDMPNLSIFSHERVKWISLISCRIQPRLNFNILIAKATQADQIQSSLKRCWDQILGTWFATWMKWFSRPGWQH